MLYSIVALVLFKNHIVAMHLLIQMNEYMILGSIDRAPVGHTI